MNYLPRTIQPVIEEASKFFKIVMVSGMRQVGKSTLLKQLSSDKRTIISFDDINNLESAKNAPLQFLQLNPPPCFFNQVQRIPEIFKALKISVDSRSEKGLYWLSGSQKLSLMSQVSDALPGRLMNFELWPFPFMKLQGKVWNKSLTFLVFLFHQISPFLILLILGMLFSKDFGRS